MAEGGRKNNDEMETLFMFAGILMFAYMLWITTKKYIAYIARWVYGTITMPVWLGELHWGQYGGTIVCFIIALIIFGISYYYAKYKQKDSLLGYTYAGVWLFLAVFEAMVPIKDSLVTKNIDYFCNPTSPGINALFTCQYTLKDLDGISILQAIIASFIPNVIILWPAIFGAGMGVIRVMNSHPETIINKRHDIESFIREQKVLYPHLMFYELINPNELPLNEGPLRQMDGTKRFCYSNDLVSGFMLRPNTICPDDYGKNFGTNIIVPGLDVLNIDLEKKDNLVPVIDPEKFRRIMVQQLGEPWSGIDNIQPIEMVILAITIPRACAEDESLSDDEFYQIRDDSYKRIDYIWDWVDRDIRKKRTEEDVDRGFYDFDKLEEYKDIVKKWIDHPIAVKIISKHAYTRTILIAFIEAARKTGVFAPTEIRWMKLYDRTLWAMVQNVGRPSLYCENLGASSHYLMEKTLNRRIYEPSFNIAYEGLVEQLRFYKFSEEEIDIWMKMKAMKETDKETALTRLSEIQNQRYESDLETVLNHEEQS